MSHQSRGKAVIFTHKEYSEELKNEYPYDITRKGAEKEKLQLEKTLKILGFEIEPDCDDLKKEDVMKKLEKISKEDHEERDALFIAVMTHGEPGDTENGERGTWLLAYDDKYDMNRLWCPFTADKCPSLANKPKIFIIQACQGESTDAGTTLYREDSQTDSTKFNEATPVRSATSLPYFTIPNQADFMICFATIPGFVTFRGVLVRNLCKVLEEKSGSTHLMDMMTEVLRNIAVDFSSRNTTNPELDNKKLMPCVFSLMTRSSLSETTEIADSEIDEPDEKEDEVIKVEHALKLIEESLLTRSDHQFEEIISDIFKCLAKHQPRTSKRSGAFLSKFFRTKGSNN
ncbi:caspase-1-like isoform X2 [Artemia franciscana]|uniref:caspase-1-like isoform X2 n=1 Tax=Artemia franciscana TaxID=6661 RepID=UPI0032DA5855